VGPTVIIAEVPHVDRVVAALQGAGIGVTYDEVAGDHVTHLRMELSQVLAFLSSRLTGATPTTVSAVSWGAPKERSAQ
jgi:hypothetical protein